MRIKGLTRMFKGLGANDTPRGYRFAQNADHLATNSPFSTFFTEVVCDVGTTPPQTAAAPPPGGVGMTPSKAPTRR